MNIVHTVAELRPAGGKACVAIGVFDGVHLGHQQVIRQTLVDAEQHEALAVVVTFDRHPSAVVAPEVKAVLADSGFYSEAAVRGVECTFLVAVRTCKGTALVAEEETLEQVLW